MRSWKSVGTEEYWEGFFIEAAEVALSDTLSNAVGVTVPTFDAGIGRSAAATTGVGTLHQGVGPFRSFRFWVLGSTTDFEVNLRYGLFDGDTLFESGSSPVSAAGTLEREVSGAIIIPGPFSFDVEETSGLAIVDISIWFVVSTWPVAS